MNSINFRRFLTTSMALALSATVVAGSQSQAQEGSRSHWASDYVAEYAEKGVISSEDFGEMDPAQVATFGDLAIMMRHVYLQVADPTFSGDFIENDDFEVESINYLMDKGIIIENTYTASREAYRIELIMLLADALRFELHDYSDMETGFVDGGDFGRNYNATIAFFKEYGVISGKSNDVLAGEDPLTLGELVAVTQKALETFPKGFVPEGIEKFEGTGFDMEIPEFNDSYKISELPYLMTIYADEYEKTSYFKGWDEEETFTWNTKEGGLTSSKDTDTELSPFHAFLRNKIPVNSSFYRPVTTEWGQSIDVTVHLVGADKEDIKQMQNGEVFYTDEYGNEISPNCFVYTRNPDLATLCQMPIDAQHNYLEEPTEILNELYSLMPTQLEKNGGQLQEDYDTSRANELAKMVVFSTYMTEEQSHEGTTVTWHTVPKDGVFVSTNEPEGNSPIRDQIYDTFDENGQGIGVAISEWAKEADFAFTLTMGEDGYYFAYTDHESLAYRLNLPTSSDVGSVPSTDPTPMDENGETMYNVYALDQDTSGLVVLAEELALLLDEKILQVGDTFTWYTKDATATASQKSGTEMMDVIDAFMKEYKAFIHPSASEIMKEETIIFEVGKREDGSLFFFVNNEIFAFMLGFPMTLQEDYVSIAPIDWLVNLGPRVHIASAESSI